MRRHLLSGKGRVPQPGRAASDRVSGLQGRRSRLGEQTIISLDHVTGHNRFFISSPDLLAITSLDGCLHEVNPAFAHAMDYTARDLRGQNLLELAHPDDRAPAAAALRGLAGGAEPQRFACRARRRDGTYLSLHWHAALDRDAGVICASARTSESVQEMRAGELERSVQRYRALFEHAPDAIMVYDVDLQRLIDANRKAGQLFDCSREQLLAAGSLTYFSHSSIDGSIGESFQEHTHRALAGEEILVERTIQTAGGAVKHCEVHLVRLSVEDRRLLRVSCIDSTARRQVEEAGHRMDRQFREILRMAPVGAVILDALGTIEYANEAIATLFEYPGNELVGKSLAQLYPEERRHAMLALLRKCTSHNDGSPHEVEAITRTGRHLIVQIATVTFEGLDGQSRRSAFVIDRTEQKRAETHLAHSASHDPLTGLPNRAFFFDQLVQQLHYAAGEQSAFAVLQIDLNRFKQVNDTLGHAAGDMVLSTQARRMRAALRAGDILARLGGDEFAVLLPGADEQASLLVAEKLRCTICTELPVDRAMVSVNASIGIAVYPHHADEAAELLRGADLAMYTAKAKGGGVIVYSTEVEEQSAHRRELLQDLHVAAERGQLRLFFQPVMESDAGTVVRAEALLRWQHPTLGLLRPRRFLPAADLSDTMDRVSLWVLDEALRQCRRWRENGKRVGVEVNMPVRVLQDSTWPNHIDTLLARYRLEPRTLTLTISEHALMTALDSMLPVLSTLSEMGVRIGLDEFGVGQSSLSALSRLPLSQIKVDRSFVAQASTAQGSSLIAMIIGISSTLGLTAVVDGVEHQETWDWLRSLGQLELQGYSGGRPLPSEEFARWLGAQ